MKRLLDPAQLPPLAASAVRAIRFGLKAAVVAAFLSFLIPNQYRSEASVLPSDDASSALGGIAGAAAAFGVNLPFGGGNIDDNLGDILQSRWMLEQLLTTEYKFHERSWYFGKDAFRQETLYAYYDKADMDKAVEKLEDKFTVTRDQKSKLYTVTMESYSPELSQAVLHRAIQLLGTFLTEKTKTRGGEKAAYAAHRLEEAKRDAEDMEAKFQRFLESNRNYQASPDPAVQILGHRLEAEVNLRRQLVTTLTLNEENAALEAKNDVPILNILDDGNLPQEKSKPWRSVIVLLVLLLSAGGHWLWANREWVKLRLRASEA